MIVTLLGAKRLSSVTLPEKVRGKFYLESADAQGIPFEFSIEAVEGKWILKSGEGKRLYDLDGELRTEITLKPMQVYPVLDDEAVLYVEPDTANRKQYRKICLLPGQEITIGRNAENTIVYRNPFISNIHTVLTPEKDKWIVSDYNSKNGTFLNGKAIEEHEIKLGDVIYLMGLKIIFAKDFLAFNNPDDLVSVKNEEEKKVYPAKREDCGDMEKKKALQKECFFQSPRFKWDIEKEKIKIDMPPADETKDETPMALVLGPSITMGLASMTSGIFTIHNALNNGQGSAAVSSGIMCGSMLLGCILWPVLNRSFESNRKKKKEALRQEKYTEYLQQKEQEIREKCWKEEEILGENFRTADIYAKRIIGSERELWERSPRHNDFLQFRVGTGALPFVGEISRPEKAFTIEEDLLKEKMYQLCEQPHELHDVPITISLFQEYCTGIVGEKSLNRKLALQMIVQIIASYSYKDVKLIFLMEEDDELYSFVKWLPHIWTEDKSLRLLAVDVNDLKHITSVLGREMEERIQCQEAEGKEKSPYYLLFSFKRDLEVRFELLEKIRSCKKNLNFSTVSVYEKISELPKECTVVAELDKAGGKLYSQKDISGKETDFKLDKEIGCDLRELGIKIANIPLADREGSYQIPSVLSFLQMFGVGKIEHLNSLLRWQENDPVKSLETPIGVDTFGELFKLDLHQNAHGPHGLVAGMTGSGKSEFIMTYILSLAVNFHPDEVAFILIDYKGGGMAKSFAALPHTAGIITNLDGASIKRSLASIESELKYREEIFAETGLKEGISNLDIYKYQKLYREKAVAVPLPHLFIISDEFAELKTQQPEFMTQLISAARIGRSLGVHLILATQKPSGVVDDQIWSNTRFRVCLKVQEKADSMDMLKRPEAAELKYTGRFYLQVGYNELFKLGQSAWAGAPYEPKDKVEEQKDDGILVIDRTGNVQKSVILDRRKTASGRPVKQLDAIVHYLRRIAEEENIHVKALWLDPMSEVLLLETLKEKYSFEKKESYVLNPVIGEYDKPAAQKEKRAMLCLPLTEQGNVLIYGAAGSGKEQLLIAMIYSLLLEHTPQQVSLYLLDFGAESLQAFARAPQVGDVVFAAEREKICNLFKMLYRAVEERKRILTQYGGDFQSYEAEAEISFPSIVIVMNNYAVFSENCEEMEDTLTYFVREGTKYGIYFVVTATALNDMRVRMRTNFPQQITMNMNDETDYTAVFGNLEGLIPAKCKGRGLIKLDAVYEFQTASIMEQSAPAAFLRQECERMDAAWKGRRTPRIPILPERVDADNMKEYLPDMEKLELPVGIMSQNLETAVYPLTSSYIHLILSNGDTYINFTGNMIRLLKKSGWEYSVLDVKGQLKSFVSGGMPYFTGLQSCEKEVENLFTIVRDRNNTYKTAVEENRKPEEFPVRVVLISSVYALKEAAGDRAKEMLELILLKGAVTYNVYVMIAESAAHISGFTYAGWFKQNVKTDFGIWAGEGFREQYQMKASKIIGGRRNEEEEENFGYVLKKGRAYKTKLMYTGEEEDEESIG